MQIATDYKTHNSMQFIEQNPRQYLLVVIRLLNFKHMSNQKQFNDKKRK